MIRKILVFGYNEMPCFIIEDHVYVVCKLYVYKNKNKILKSEKWVFYYMFRLLILQYTGYRFILLKSKSLLYTLSN